ncbi:MAG: tetratricopeptide repeat protein [Bacteriovoracaceae bacterium]
MKSVFFILSLIVLASCSSSRIERKIEDVQWDSLADESYLRWGESRLEKNASSQMPVINCYKGKSKETLVQYKKDYEKLVGTPYYWLHVGNCYFVEDKWSKAEFYYRMSLDEAKNATIKSIAQNNLALISFKHEQWEKGKELLKESMKTASDFKVPRYNMAQLYLQFGHYDRAIELLTSGPFKGSQDIDVFFLLANAHLYKGDLETSGKYFAMIPKNHFEREDIAATYALYLIRKNDIKGAFAVMKARKRSGVLEITAISQKIEKMLAVRMKEKQE